MQRCLTQKEQHSRGPTSTRSLIRYRISSHAQLTNQLIVHYGSGEPH
jgi:hypothetical protein